MAANSKECEDRNRVLKEEREIMSAHFKELKDQMNKLREAARAELMVLTLQSNASIKELKRVTDKVCLIFRLFAIREAISKENASHHLL